MQLNIHIAGSEISEGMGSPPELVAESKYCDECNREHEFEKCPQCGSWIDHGFGLAFGGFGFYQFCRSERCDWFYKVLCED